MTEILLTIILLANIGYLVWYTHQNNLKEAKYIKAILAKNLPEMVQSELIEKEEPAEDKLSEFIPLEEADDELFAKHIKQEAQIDN
jgi:DNA-binding MarR family transcriptional regulator